MQVVNFILLEGLAIWCKITWKKVKEEFLANTIRGSIKEDDTTLDNSPMERSRKWNRHSKKEKHAKDEPFSLENNQQSFVSCENRTTRVRGKQQEKLEKEN